MCLSDNIVPPTHHLTEGQAPAFAGLPRLLFRSRRRRAHAGELGFRDFSSLFLVKENRRQLGNSARSTCLVKVGLTSLVSAMEHNEAKVKDSTNSRMW